MTEKYGDVYYIDGSRIKTGTNFFTPILPAALEVLKKYNYTLPKISNQKCNQGLRVVKGLARVNKPMTTHVALLCNTVPESWHLHGASFTYVGTYKNTDDTNLRQDTQEEHH